jgi:tetratricopeptide (TPR) repeat protein
MIYARATVLMKNGMNDQALVALQERKSTPAGFPFLYLDYLEGTARLNKLDAGARDYFRRYIHDFRGMNYLRSATQRLAWISLLEGDTAGYLNLMIRASGMGASVVEEDKQAKDDAGSGVVPNPVLLRTRLLFDGGYYDLAMKELLNHPLKVSVKTKRDLVEYTYRMGRICQETGKDSRALEYFRLTVERGRSEPYYFAANAAYQAGLLYENTGAYVRADSAYRLCLSMKPSEYRMSIHQKARAALERIRPFQPKT